MGWAKSEAGVAVEGPRGAVLRGLLSAGDLAKCTAGKGTASGAHLVRVRNGTGGAGVLEVQQPCNTGGKKLWKGQGLAPAAETPSKRSWAAPEGV